MRIYYSSQSSKRIASYGINDSGRDTLEINKRKSQIEKFIERWGENYLERILIKKK